MATDLYVGGAVYSPAAPDATALAVTDGIVVWVGSDDVGHALHPGARIVDLDGRFVAPAFVDSHVHLTSTGLALGGLTLSSATSRSDCLALLAAAHAVAAPGALLWGPAGTTRPGTPQSPARTIPHHRRDRRDRGRASRLPVPYRRAFGRRVHRLA